MVGYNSDGTRMNHPITIEQYNSSAETFILSIGTPGTGCVGV